MSRYFYHELHKEWERYNDMLSILKELYSEGKYTKSELTKYIEKARETYMPRIRELNRAYDKYLSEPHWRLPFGYPEDCYDSRAIFYELPYVVEDKEEFIEENWEHWYNPWEDGRDCTGVWFTSYIKLFPIPKANKTIVYHVQNCDV